MIKKLLVFGAVAALSLPSTSEAQGRGRNADGVPPGHRPPPGMCRVWIDGVPPGRQPAPTSCAEALRTRPSNARVIFGDDARNDGRHKKGKAKKAGKQGRDSDRDADRERKDRRFPGDSRYPADSRYPTSRDGDLCVDRDRNGVCDDRQERRRSTDGGYVGPIVDEILRERSRRQP